MPVNVWGGSAFLLEAASQQEDELFIRQSFEGADGNIEGLPRALFGEPDYLLYLLCLV